MHLLFGYACLICFRLILGDIFHYLIHFFNHISTWFFKSIWNLFVLLHVYSSNMRIDGVRAYFDLKKTEMKLIVYLIYISHRKKNDACILHGKCAKKMCKREIHIYKGFSVKFDDQKNCIWKKDKTTKIKLFQFNLDDIKKILPIVVRVYRFFSLYCFTRVYHIWRQKPYI